MRILHLTDPHMTAAGLNRFGVDPAEKLGETLEIADAAWPDIDVIAVSGDIADDNDSQSYLRVREIVAEYADKWGVSQCYCLGNHDIFTDWGAVFGSGILNADGEDIGNGNDCGYSSAVIDGWRFIVLDTHRDNQDPGFLDQAQAKWLKTLLSTPSEKGSVIVMHHPPVALEANFDNNAGFTAKNELAQCLAGSDVKLILCGHLHRDFVGVFAGVTVVANGGTAGRLDYPQHPANLAPEPGAAFAVVDLAGDFAPLTHIVRV